MVHLIERIEAILGARPTRLQRLHGGIAGHHVHLAYLPDGNRLVVKMTRVGEGGLDIEAHMLKYLRQHSNLPVPDVIYESHDLLVMSYIEGVSAFDESVQKHAADILADLHNIRANAFGFEQDTLIGGLIQPNTWHESWVAFFCEERLMFMARKALSEGRIEVQMMRRIEAFCSKADQWLEEPAHPSLLHGDAWTGNILAKNGRITGFLDPAIYYGHAEIELAFTTLFGTFDRSFFDPYEEIRPIKPGFHELRRDLYNLYPLLVHVRLFGGGYLSGIDRILARVGI